MPAELIAYGPGSAAKLPFLFLTVPMDYQAEATTLEGFIQQLAVGYLCRGYWYYFQGVIPAGKDPHALDAKLIARYGIGLSKFQRCRRKRLGHASVQYLRYGRHFVLLATEGRHDLLRADHRLRDAREAPIRLGGYAVAAAWWPRPGADRSGGVEGAAGLLPGARESPVGRVVRAGVLAVAV